MQPYRKDTNDCTTRTVGIHYLRLRTSRKTARRLKVELHADLGEAGHENRLRPLPDGVCIAFRQNRIGSQRVVQIEVHRCAESVEREKLPEPEVELPPGAGVDFDQQTIMGRRRASSRDGLSASG